MLARSKFSIKTLWNRASKKYSTQSKNPIYVFNSLSKTKEPLKLRNNVLYWYSCGPTVYNSAHLGHARFVYFIIKNPCQLKKLAGSLSFVSSLSLYLSSYVNFDIIKRILTNYFHINVVNLMNITDIDDKIIVRSIKEKKNFLDITQFYEKEFLDDLSLLNCVKPSIILRVTDHVEEILKFIQTLVDLKKAYATSSGSVYFDSQNFQIRSFFEQVQTNMDTDSKDNKEKRHPYDFALWKARKEDSEPSWPSPWGPGRPGWHIECSTLANVAFGRDIDFHSGGKDLIFPHHHNEMVQCCAFHGIDKWSSFWLHTGHLHLKNDVKMSKSLSNTISIRDMLSKYTTNHFRMFCLLSPYRNNKEFSDDKMVKPVNLVNSFLSFLNLVDNFANKKIQTLEFRANENEVLQKLEETNNKIHAALSNDFDTCLVIDELTDLVNFMNKNFQSCTTIRPVDDFNRHYGCVMSVHNFTKWILEMLGLVFDEEKYKTSSLKIDDIVESSLKFRNLIRNFALDKDRNLSKEIKMELLQYCDDFRKNLNQSNIEFKVI